MNQDSLNTFFDRLLAKAQADPDLADLLRQLATHTLDALPPAGDTKPSKGAPPAAAAELASATELATFVDRFAVRPTPPKTPDVVKSPHVSADIPIAAIPARMHLKAKACCWLADHGYTHDPVALGEHRTLIAEAKAADCYLWMLDLAFVNPNQPEAFSLLAANFSATAQVVEHWLELAGQPSEKAVVQLAAQAQAALREAVSQVRESPDGLFPFIDDDQRALFLELKRYSGEKQLFLKGLALRDHVEPERVGERLEALGTLKAKLTLDYERTKTRTNALKRLKYHVEKLQDNPHNPMHDWQRVADAVAGLHQAGVPESDRDLRDALAPVAPLLPADTPHVQVVRVLGGLVALERAKAARQTEPSPQPADDTPVEVTRAAKLIAGRTLVVIGGKPNPNTIGQLESTLRCTVDWVDTKPHTSPSTFAPKILGKDVVLILLLIRWSSHVYKEVDALCRGNGRYLVRVTGGYNVKTVARAILDQAGDRLQGGL